METELTNFSVTAATSDSTTPPRATIKPPSFTAYTNGFKRRHCTTAPPPSITVSYKECMRNHAAGIGGHAIDGCCEFMASESESESSLNCAACGCHRNFHRRDPDDPTPIARSQLFSPTETETENWKQQTRKLQHHSPVARSEMVKRKRFRTRFSQEQKEKMHEFAEKLGWKLQRVDKKLIEEFCGEIGVGKEVLKVWMHNNKSTFGRREIGGSFNGGIIDGEFAAGGKLAGKGEGDGDGYSSSG